MAKFNCVALGFVAVAIGVVSAVTEEEKSTVRLAVLPVLASCGSELGITKEQVLAAKESKNFDALNPCFYACFFKKMGTMTSEGLYDPAVAKNSHAKYIHGEDDLKKLDEISDKCASVNEQSVSDGAKGCERAKLLAHCLKENIVHIHEGGSFTPLSS